jgi:hypothetical protein
MHKDAMNEHFFDQSPEGNWCLVDTQSRREWEEWLESHYDDSSLPYYAMKLDTPINKFNIIIVDNVG